MDSDLEMLVSMAKEGDKKALEELVLQIQDKIYGLALRMLYHPSDAEDASQEILLRIVTHLGTFREKAPLAPGRTGWLPITCLPCASAGRNSGRCPLRNTKRVVI